MRFRSPAAAALAAVAVPALAALAAVPAAIAAPAGQAATAAAERTAFIGLGDLSPTLSLAVSPAGQPEAVVIGKSHSLWFYYQAKGRWHRTRLAGPGSAFAGPALAAGPRGTAFVAVKGASHTLQYFALSKGRWRHTQVAGMHTTYSDPSLALGPHGPGIAAQGRNNVLWYYSLGRGRWHASKVSGQFTAFSAPSLVIRNSRQAGPGNPAGQVDITVQGPNHSLRYYHWQIRGRWKSASIARSAGTVFSAPSLLDLRDRSAGQSYIVAEGAGHSLTAWSSSPGWHAVRSMPGAGQVFSVPTVAQGDPRRPIEIAFRGQSRSIWVVCFSPALGLWMNDAIGAASGVVASPPALVNRWSRPSGESDLIFQSRTGELWYYRAPVPLPPNTAPRFTGIRIAGRGTTFGG